MNFFIGRRIVAIVIAILTVIIGVITIVTLPLAGLAYIGAFAPDSGELVASLIKNPVPAGAGAADLVAARRISFSRSLENLRRRSLPM